MYDNLKSLGITNPDEIDRYSLRQEANNDILKIYFQKDKGEFFAKSVKFKYPRQRKPSSPTASARATKRSRRSARTCATLSMSWIRSASAIALKSISSVKSSTIYAIWKVWSPIRSAKSKPIWKSSPVSKRIPGGASPDRAGGIKPLPTACIVQGRVWRVATRHFFTSTP